MVGIFVLLAVLGIAPSLVWLIFYLREDAAHPEPKKLLLYAFLAGAGITFVVLPVQIFLNGTFVSQGASIYRPLALLLFAGAEEIFKFIAAYLIVSRRKEFDEPIDAMIYMITAALGFAAVENTASLLQTTDGTFISSGSLETTILRFIGATLLHTLSSGLVGYYWGRAMVRAQDSNYHQVEKLKNEMISRRDDKVVPKRYDKEEQQRNQPFLSFLREAKRIFLIFCVNRRRRSAEATTSSSRLEYEQNPLRSIDDSLNPVPRSNYGSAIAWGLVAATLLHTIFNYFILKFEAITVPTLFLVGAAFFILADFEKLKKLEE